MRRRKNRKCRIIHYFFGNRHSNGSGRGRGDLGLSWRHRQSRRELNLTKSLKRRRKKSWWWCRIVGFSSSPSPFSCHLGRRPAPVCNPPPRIEPLIAGGGGRRRRDRRRTKTWTNMRRYLHFSSPSPSSSAIQDVVGASSSSSPFSPPPRPSSSSVPSGCQSTKHGHHFGQRKEREEGGEGMRWVG